MDALQSQVPLAGVDIQLNRRNADVRETRLGLGEMCTVRLFCSKCGSLGRPLVVGGYGLVLICNYVG